MGQYEHGNRCKFLLRYHLILVCKYRRKILLYQNISDDIKRLSLDISTNHNTKILFMETDNDHIHYMIETTPNINLSNYVRTLKSFTTFHLWQKYNYFLSKIYWKEKTFWSDGYFISTIGDVSSTTLRQYIENQGK